MIKYDRIGIDYNETRKPDPYLCDRLFHLLNPKKDSIYLDIGCGTGNYTCQIFKRGVQLIGVDPSMEMLEIARSRTDGIIWKKGNAENIPLENNSVEGVMASLTLHHWADLNKGFNELNRVIKKGGQIVFFTATPKQMEGYWLNEYFPKMLQVSIEQMPTFNFIKNNLDKNGFKIISTEKYFIKNDLQDLFLYAGKNRPKLYLNKKMRKGISSFSDLANKEEVEHGLEKLKEDILSERINRVIKNYENEKGDYLFIVAESGIYSA